MTPQTKCLQAVREACPELMELSYDCKLNFAGRYGTLKEHSKKGKEIQWAKLFFPDMDGKGMEEMVTFDVLKGDDWNCVEIIGHPPQLQHWMNLLGKHNLFVLSTTGMLREVSIHGHKKVLEFNMKTGQPATDEDYQALLDVIE